MPLKLDGKKYEIPGIGNIMLYPIAKISQALTDADIPRDTQTIRKWETRGIIPKAIFRSGHKRLYTMEQINCIVNVAKECNIKQGSSIDSTNFASRIWEELDKIDKDYREKMSKA